jgi:fatty acid desaturase
VTPRQPFRLDPRGYDDTQMRARRTVHRVRLDCAGIIAAASKRARRREIRRRVLAVLVLVVGAWAAAYVRGARGLDAVLFAVVAAGSFTALLLALDRRTR